MKKFIALLLAGVLTCGLGITAFAANSPAAEDFKEEAVQTELKDKVNQVAASTTVSTEKVDQLINVDGAEFTVVSAADADASKNASAVETLIAQNPELQAAAISTETKLVPVVINLDVKPSNEDAEELIAKGAVTLTVSAPGVAEGDAIMVLHQKADGVWEVLKDAVAGKGVFTATFTSFSPVKVVKVAIEKAEAPAANNNAAAATPSSNNTVADNTAAGTTSPKTADVIPYVVLFAVAAMGAAVVSGKKALNK